MIVDAKVLSQSFEIQGIKGDLKQLLNFPRSLEPKRKWMLEIQQVCYHTKDFLNKQIIATCHLCDWVSAEGMLTGAVGACTEYNPYLQTLSVHITLKFQHFSPPPQSYVTRGALCKANTKCNCRHCSCGAPIKLSTGIVPTKIPISKVLKKITGNQLRNPRMVIACNQNYSFNDVFSKKGHSSQ